MLWFELYFKRLGKTWSVHLEAAGQKIGKRDVVEID